MPGNSVAINGSDYLTWYVGDSKIEKVISLLERVGIKMKHESKMKELPPGREGKKKPTKLKTLAIADWDTLEEDVVKRIRALKIIVEKSKEDEISDKIANDLILPNVKLLAEFCVNVEIEEEET